MNKPIICAYYYGAYQPLSKEGEEAIDIINYSFAQIAKAESGFTIDLAGVADIDKIAQFKKLGKRVCLSLGGWQTYQEASQTIESRKTVARAILKVLKLYNLDGIDLDWEYPRPEDRDNFTLLIKEIYEVLKTSNPEYLVSIAIPGNTISGKRYDYQALSPYIDYFYVMTYDLDLGLTKTHHLSALGDAKKCFDYLINEGAKPQQLVIGAAFYGRRYQVDNAINNGLNEAYQEIKTFHYDQLLKDIKETKAILYFDEDNSAEYYYSKKDNFFYTLDTPRAIKLKYAYGIEFGGLMFWCYQNDPSMELLKALKEAK